MATYKITLKFDTATIQKINNNGFQLCFTAGMGDNVDYNVIAWCSQISTNVSISWTDKYLIAATKSTFSNGAIFDMSTTPAPIKFKQRYPLPSDWTDGTVQTDDSLGAGQFAFENLTKGDASAVVLKMIKDVPAPFYVSESPVFSKGTERLIPKTMVALWFQKNAETQKMISLNSSQFSEFNMTGKTNIDLVWNGAEFVLAGSMLDDWSPVHDREHKSIEQDVRA